MTIVPVGTAQVGCTVTEAVGAAGTVGTALTVSGVGAETQVISVVEQRSHYELLERRV